MDPMAHFVLQQHMRRFDASCGAAVSRLRMARTLQDVVRIMEVRPDPLIRHLPETRRAQGQVVHAAEERAEHFVKDLIERMAKTSAEHLPRVAREVQASLRLLQGRLPRQYTVLERGWQTHRKKPAGHQPDPTQ